MKHRIPKDIDKYITPWVAAARLMYIGLDYIACKRNGVRVKWTLKLSFYYPPDYKTNAVALPMGGTFTSGEDLKEESSESEAS